MYTPKDDSPFRRWSTELFPIPQLQSPLPMTDDSDFWDQYDIVEVSDNVDVDLKFQVKRIVYEETKLKAEGQILTQRHLETLGAKSRPVITCPFERKFPMYLMRGSVLKQQERILKHEELIAKNLLIEVKQFLYINLQAKTTHTPRAQNPDDIRVRQFGVFLPILSSGKILKPWKRIIFISHRWLNPLGSPTSPPHPDDDNNTKLKQLKGIIRDDDYVMMDYMCFPQNDYDGQGNAINSLSWYIYHCSHYQVICPDLESFEAFLGRGWCQVELLSAFCPVLSHHDEKTAGNFYLDYEKTYINDYYTFAASDRALIFGDGYKLPLTLVMINNPKHMAFSVPEDVIRVQGLINTVISAFKQSLPREQHYTQQGQLTENNPVTYKIRFDEASKIDIESLLQMLST